MEKFVQIKKDSLRSSIMFVPSGFKNILEFLTHTYVSITEGKGTVKETGILNRFWNTFDEFITKTGDKPLVESGHLLKMNQMSIIEAVGIRLTPDENEE